LIIRRAFIALALPVVAISIGCNAGPATGTVAGQVLFDGKPYGDAAVVFFSLTSGGGDTANLAEDGSFSLPTKLVVGDYRVYLAPKLAAPTGDDAPPAPVKTDNSLPDKYWSESSTDITVTVAPGENNVIIELKR
jgi:hypothetical protein